RSLPQQLLQLPGAGDEAVGHVDAADRHRGERLIGRLGNGRRHPELEVREMQDVSLAEGGVLHELPVHERPVRALPVAQPQAPLRLECVLADSGAQLVSARFHLWDTSKWQTKSVPRSLQGPSLRKARYTLPSLEMVSP